MRRRARLAGTLVPLLILGACAKDEPRVERAGASTTTTATAALAPRPTTVTAPTPTSPPTSPPTTTPAPADPAGVGDAYFPQLGNGGYDVGRYDVVLRADPPNSDAIAVQVNITATATATLASFHLDLSGMTVQTVTVDGSAALFRREGDELVITPVRPVAAGATFVTVLQYSGVPEPVLDAEVTPLGWLRAGDTTYVVSEPNGAHGWLASNDHPSDKALFRFRVDVPQGLTAAANGRLVSTLAENGRTVWTWETAEPMATYLATIAIGSFTIVDGGTTQGVRIRHALPATLASRLSPLLETTPQMVEVLSSMFGPYPFSDYGVLVIDARLGYALEIQTLSLIDRNILIGNKSAAIQIHELAHQWFGNSVSVREWRDIWLTEGFATYAESLWRERTERNFDIDATMRALAATNYAPIGDPGPARLFAPNVYNRGALTLHALRRHLGDAPFFSVVLAWASERRGGNGSTAEFIELASRVGGRDVAPLVQSWLYDTPMPRLPA